MDPNSYKAYIVGQAGPDSPYRFGSTSSKYVQHLAKVAPLGRSARATGSAIGLSIAAISPYDNPYNTTAGKTASLSIGLDISDAAPVLATAGPAASPSVGAISRPETPTLTIAGPDSSPSIAADTRPITPHLSVGGDSIPCSLSHSTSRSSSPDAVALISSLASYESLSDDALYDAALKAQQAMVKWQDQYMALQTEISRTRESPYNRKNPKPNPRKLEEPEEYDRKHHNFLQHADPNTTRTTGNNPGNIARPRASNPINKPKINGCRTSNELHIDMNEPMQPVEGKRIRKPRVLHDAAMAVTAPPKAAKRLREPENNTFNTSTIDQPATKKQHTRTRSITPPQWINTARNIKSITKEPSAARENLPKKRQRPAKSTNQVVIKKEPKEETKGKDSVRAAAARLMWAKRQASGTNGRNGGAPKEGTMAKAKGKEAGMEGRLDRRG
ncbi:MAG: hypothetical protein ASARMPRED_007739 [Alectoria sarmentosa]|nr:MAG: hypothetical protein ASARMPRED_007739 [Alectoria sarmentosa]